MSTEYTPRSNTDAPTVRPANSLENVNQPRGDGTLGGANSTAFWLSVAGLAVQGLALILTATMYSAFSGFGAGMFGMMGYYGGMMGPYYGTGWYGATWVWLAFALAAVAVGVLGVALMNTRDAGRLRGGAVLVLLSAVLAFPTMWGFWIGSTLMFIGAVMGLATTESRPQGSPG